MNIELIFVILLLLALSYFAGGILYINLKYHRHFKPPAFQASNESTQLASSAYPMGNTQFSASDIIEILAAEEAGKTVGDICQEYGIDQSTYLNWKKKYRNMHPPELQRLKQLEQENHRLKQMYAEFSLDYRHLKEVIEENKAC